MFPTKDFEIPTEPSLVEKNGRRILSSLGHKISRITEHGLRIQRSFGVVYRLFDEVKKLAKKPTARLPSLICLPWDGICTFRPGHFLFFLVFTIILRRNTSLLRLLSFTLQSSLYALSHLMYPRTHPTSTRQPILARCLYYIVTSSSLVTCLLYPHDAQSQYMLRLLPASERRVFGDIHKHSLAELIDALDQWATRHHLAATDAADTEPERNGMVYLFCGRHFRYIGKSTRDRNEPGGVGRLHEHFSGCYNRKSKEFGTKRYKRGRLEFRFHICFMILLVGPELMTSASELCLINSLKPNGNGKMSTSRRGPRSSRKHRPRPHERLYLPKLEHSNPLEHSQTQNWIAKKMSSLQQERKEKEKQDESGLPYAQNYARHMRIWHRRTGQQGPLNIMDTTYQTLFLQYLAKAAHFNGWDSFVAYRGSSDCLVSLWDLVDQFSSRSRKRIIRYKLKQGCIRFGIPSKPPATFHVADKAERNVVKKFLRKSLMHLRAYSVAVTSWVVKRTKFPVASLPKVFLRRKAAFAARTSDIQEIVKAPDFPELIEEACVGKKLNRIPGSTKFPEPDGKAQLRRKYSETTRLWGKSIGLSVKNRSHLQHQATTSLSFASPTPLIAQETQDFLDKLSPGVDDLLIPEDKSPAETWRWPRRVYLVRLWREVTSAGWRYLPGASPEDAHAVIRDFLIDTLPAKFKYFQTTIRHWKRNMTPYVYLSVKLKCWRPSAVGTSGGSRCPEFDTHSCFRKICSFIMFFNRRFMRKVHRACQCILEHLSDISLWHLGRAPRTLKTKFQKT